VTLLELTQLEVSYGAIKAVRGVDLHVDEGEIIAVIGPNGAGKTSLLGAVVGRVKVRGGEVSYRGEQIAGRSPEDNIAAGIALVPEGRHIFTRLTVAENLRLGATVRGDSGIDEDIDRQLDRFPVLGRVYRGNAGKLSGGEQQQLAIARALLSRPTLLLLDEPSLGLAPLVITEVFAALEQLRGEGMTIVLVEQHASRAITLADRTYVMSGGRVVLEGTAQTLDSPEAIASAYLGSAKRVRGRST
jgi:branched-chain amino acid transport system ATP-binding protein